MSKANQPICEACWVSQNITVSRFLDITYRIPVRMHASRIPRRGNRCSYCGWPTWAGIYVRRDASEVAYPREVET